MQATWLHLERRLLGVVIMPGVAKCAAGCRGFCEVIGVTCCHSKDVSTARVILSLVGATSPASTLDVSCKLVGALAEGTKKTAGRSQLRQLHFALQQRVVVCAAWLA